jgi:P-type Cu+ transporter
LLMLGGACHESIPRWLQFLLATPVQWWIGARFYRGAWHALGAGTSNMDVQVALSTGAAWGFSSVVTLGGLIHQPVYFEASATIITLIFMGKLLESRAKRATSAALENLLHLQPKTALCEIAGVASEVDIADIVPAI